MLRVERQGELAIWIVDRPQRRNAMDWATMEAFAQTVAEATRDPGLRVVILTGAGEAFLSGADLYEMAHYRTEADGYRLGQVMGEALRQLEEAPWISIAAINGPARGGGVEVALACDLRVMAEDADLAFVQVAWALTPGWGGGQRLRRRIGPGRALELLLTARRVSAEEALRLGLIERVAPVGQALAEAQALAREILRWDAEAVRAIKAMIRDGDSLPFHKALQMEREQFAHLWAAPAHWAAMERFLQRNRQGLDPGRAG
ncbi:MAG: enoyl-CoA hydratase/isomerase family protein [Anaerolineae bacterium]|uniref:enoyl-CoA hydratase/isomerase family protein n=1 Tax=Thermoflexus sp. TaxID=1969742 RepID=UPI0025EF138E|nr:enoyl-CoA hydratase/isomerase family protein [Thermoflexus sp.]MCS7352315.1 enoyl-CoA hydratase/isomerase family protein [Thermoflexus sp.]MDW8181778.1 enoyl-CoA hydratase/isomerase family protein [Anaerolineae bacterium]